MYINLDKRCINCGRVQTGVFNNFIVIATHTKYDIWLCYHCYKEFSPDDTDLLVNGIDKGVTK